MLLPIGKAAERIGVHPDTLKDWGPLGPEFTRTRGGHRRYDESVLDRWNETSTARVPARTA